ncbi:MAG: hypothetical protein WCR24_03615 [Candidatus Methanomethylophilaceae archaeon]
MDTLMVVALSAIVALAGVVFGGKVQRTARFIYPYDFMTISMCVIIGVLCVIPMPIDNYWYFPFLGGYLVGYLIVGRTSYVMVAKESLGYQLLESEPWVIYTKGESQFIQDQSNRALFTRIMFGIEHEVISNGAMEANWTFRNHYPLFPIFIRKTLRTEWYQTSTEKIRVNRFITVNKRTTTVYEAYGNMVTKAQLIQDETALRELQRQNVTLVKEVRELQREQGPALAEAAMRLEQMVDKTTPQNRMYRVISDLRDIRPTKEAKINGTTEDETVVPES